MRGDNRNNSVIVWSIDSPSHSFALSGLSNHCRTISDCSRYFAQFRTISRNFDSYSNYCLDCRVMGVLRLDRLVHTSTTSTQEVCVCVCACVCVCVCLITTHSQEISRLQGINRLHKWLKHKTRQFYKSKTNQKSSINQNKLGKSSLCLNTPGRVHEVKTEYSCCILQFKISTIKFT